jgi:hypothetical protein
MSEDNVEEIYNKERAEWEPEGPYDWFESDPLTRALQRAEIQISTQERSARSLHEAWMRLPPWLRSQVWREREIASVLVRFLPEWRETVPGLYALGVGRRNGNLAAIVNVEESLTTEERFRIREAWMGAWIQRRTVEGGPTTEEAPLGFELSPAPTLLGQVPPGGFLFGDPDPTPQSAPVLQSGDKVGSETPSGIREYGTLSCVVSDPGSTTALALCSGHVLIQPNYTFIHKTGGLLRVGKVRNVDTTVDAALAELSTPYLCDYRAKASGMVPAAPIIPTTDMPVQMHGAVSGYQSGFLNQVNTIPAGAKSAGLIPMFTADIQCVHGDSGALLLSGRGTAPAVPQWQMKHMSAVYLDSLTSAMIGVLKAGPAAGSDPNVRPQGYFTSIIQILDEMKIEAWVRQ